METMFTLAVWSVLLPVFGICAVISQDHQIVALDDHNDNSALRKTSPSPIRRAEWDELALPPRNGFGQRAFDDDFWLKLLLFIPLTFVVILLIVCKSFFCKTCHGVYATSPPPYATYSNDDGAEDKPPLYVDVVMGDCATEFPAVASIVPETPPPKYEDGNMMRF